MEPRRPGQIPPSTSDSNADRIAARTIEILMDAKGAHIPPAILLNEDPEIVRSIKRYMISGQAETDTALRAHRYRAWKGKVRCKGWDMVRDEVRDIKLRISTGRERRHRMSKPAALRQLSLGHARAISEDKVIPMVQLVPNRRHATSGYPYPRWLEDYGVLREDWASFTARIRQANRIRPGQYAVVFTVGVVFELFAWVGWPFRGAAFCGLASIGLYFSYKRRNLRRAVFDGEIPTWTAAWNLTYFGPKGLSVGFDLPGPVFEDAYVHPKRKLFGWARILHGPMRSPMRPSRAARRARITIARVHDPLRDAGGVPRVDSHHVPKVQPIVRRLRRYPINLIKRLEDRAHARLEAIEELESKTEKLSRLHQPHGQ